MFTLERCQYLTKSFSLPSISFSYICSKVLPLVLQKQSPVLEQFICRYFRTLAIVIQNQSRSKAFHFQTFASECCHSSTPASSAPHFQPKSNTFPGGGEHNYCSPSCVLSPRLASTHPATARLPCTAGSRRWTAANVLHQPVIFIARLSLPPLTAPASPPSTCLPRLPTLWTRIILLHLL